MTYNNNQLAKVIRENGIETFEWDGLALIERSGTKYINEPHVGGGNPILAIGGDGQKTEAIFTDMLGTSLGKVVENGYSAIDKTSFGADTSDKLSFFTGKPYVEDLGYAFLFRNYRSDIGKWLTQDPLYSLQSKETVSSCCDAILLGYPESWNNFSYCSNMVVSTVDIFGLLGINLVSPSDSKAYADGNAAINSSSDTYYVVAHGTQGVGITGPNATPITAQQLAAQIRNDPSYGNSIGPIVLLGCFSADGNLAQELANILNRFVKAFKGTVTIYPDGRYTGNNPQNIQPE